MRRGLTAKVIDQTKTMSDVYEAFFEFSSLMKSKVDKSDPNADLTLKRIEAIQKACISSGQLDKRGRSLYRSQPRRHTSMMIILLVVLLAILFATLSKK